MAKRKIIAAELTDQLLFECNRTCCICTTPGKDIQVHHIDKNSANNKYENLIIVCLGCHSEIHSTGGFGRNWTTGQLHQHKQEWIERVKKRKEEADNLASIASVTGEIPPQRPDLEEIDYKELDDPLLIRYLEEILIIHEAQKKIAQIGFDTGITWDSIEACDKLVAFYETVLVELATFYPKGHFQEKHPKLFFSEQIAARAIFQAYALRPEEGGFIPSMYRQFMSYRYMLDVRKMVRDIVVCLQHMTAYVEEQEGRWAENWMAE